MYVALKEILAKYDVLSPKEIDKILTAGLERNFKKGDYLFKPNRRNPDMGFLLSGIFRHYTIGRNGNEHTTTFITEGYFFTEPESFQGEGPTIGFFQAETDASVLIYDRPTYDILAAEIAEMEFVLKSIFQKTLMEQLKLARTIMIMDAKDAYMYLLQKHPTLVGRVPDQHLASYIGITKHSLSRIKKKISDTLK